MFFLGEGPFNFARQQNLSNIVLHRVENIVGEGENAWYQHFSPFSTMFTKGFFLQDVKSHHVLYRIDPLPNNKILDLSKFKAFADDKIRYGSKSEICFGKS